MSAYSRERHVFSSFPLSWAVRSSCRQLSSDSWLEKNTATHPRKRERRRKKDSECLAGVAGVSGGSVTGLKNWTTNTPTTDTPTIDTCATRNFSCTCPFYGVSQCTVLNGRKRFHRRYGATQAANRPSFAYYNTDNCPSNLRQQWTDCTL